MNPPKKAWARRSLASSPSLEVTTIVNERNCRAQAPSLILPATLMQYAKMEVQVVELFIIIGSQNVIQQRLANGNAYQIEQDEK
jgi:hypothetical protein